MINHIKHIHVRIQNVFKRNKFLVANTNVYKLSNQLILQGVIAISFFLLSLANVYSKSYIMLIFTTFGFGMNGLCSLIAWKYRNNKLCVYSTVLTCCSLFIFFVIYGGNKGFSCLWIVLFPFLGMIIMDFIVGFIACIILQIFLFVVFWTPASTILCYDYNDQFRLRFPMFFLVTFMLGLMLAISLQKSQYAEYVHGLELKEMTELANNMARCDALTTLANRRCAYEQFENHFSEPTIPHCIVMGDIDSFKKINDLHGHEFGDEVLIGISKCMLDLLPQDYLKSRWGGEEFLLAANEPIQTVYERIEVLRKGIENYEFLRDGECVKVTVTFGIAEYYESSELNEAINLADHRLYIGKKSTKNCTITS